MKIKTNELIGPALNWAVSTCLTGGELFQSGRVAHKVTLHCVGGVMGTYFMKDSGVVRCEFDPSTNWMHGGPIIEREVEQLCDDHEHGWVAYNREGVHLRGPTPLIAAMRCYVASKLGDEVDVPEELRCAPA